MTSTLPEPKEMSLEDISLSPGSAEAALHEGRKAEQQLAGALDREEVRRTLASVVAYYMSASVSIRKDGRTVFAGSQLAAMLLDFLESGEGVGRMKSFIWETDNLLELGGIISCDNRKLFYLEEFWREDTASMISKVTGVSLRTVSGWLEGAAPSSMNRRRLSNVVSVIYQFRSVCGWSDDATRAVFEHPQKELSGRSGAEVFGGSQYVTSWVAPEPFRSWLHRLGSHM